MTDDLTNGYHLGHLKGLKPAQLRKLYARVRSEVVCRTDGYTRHGGFDAFITARVGSDAAAGLFCSAALNQLRMLGMTGRMPDNYGATTPAIVTWGEGAERAEAVLREARA